MAVLHLTNENFEEEVMKAEKTVLLDFWASWCGPCRMLSPVVDEIAAEKEGSVKVAKVNVDDEQELASRFNIMSIPTLVVIRDGKVINTKTGVIPKADILEMIS